MGKPLRGKPFAGDRQIYARQGPHLLALFVAHLSFLASIIFSLSSVSSASPQRPVIISSGVAPRSAAWGILSLDSVRKNSAALIRTVMSAEVGQLPALNDY